MQPSAIVTLLVGLGLIGAMLLMLIRVRKAPPKPFVYSRWRDYPVWLRALGVLTAVNFFVFCYVAETHGGDAWNGYKRDGHYFLGRKSTYTEVSPRFWTYSYYHVLAVWLSFAAIVIAGAWEANRKGQL